MTLSKVFVLLGSLVGLSASGPVRTLGTEGKDLAQLARIDIAKHLDLRSSDKKESPVVREAMSSSRSGEGHAGALTLIFRNSYEVGGSRETLLVSPGKHTIYVTYENGQHWPST